MDASVARREVAAVGAHAPPERRLAGPLDADPCAESEAVRRRLARADAQPVVGAAVLDRLVEQEQRRPAVVRDNDVAVPVIVYVSERGAPADAGGGEPPTGPPPPFHHPPSPPLLDHPPLPPR